MDFKEIKNWFITFYVDLLNLFGMLIEKRITVDSRNEILQNIIEKISEFNVENNAKELEKNLKMIDRKNMKCVFFGKTSNGKSAVINALLGEKVLPSSKGRTTSCFVSVEGCNNLNEHFTDSVGQSHEIQQLQSLANEQKKDSCQINDLLRVYWPRHKCRLLENDLEIFDSPGVDYTKENDEWIDKYCEDADVFVLVLDCTSTLNQSERDFFMKVKRKIATPNIIVLINKWDTTDDDSEDEKEELRKQYFETICGFFKSDLQLYQETDLSERIYFISATRALQKRVEDTNSFTTFENHLIREMSHNAVKTKFGPHINRAFSSLLCLNDMINSVLQLKNETSQTWDGNFDNLKSSISQIRDLYLNKIYSETEGLVNENTTLLIKKLREAVDQEKDLDQDVIDMQERDFPKQLSAIYRRNIEELAVLITERFVVLCPYKVNIDYMKVFFGNDNSLLQTTNKYEESILENLRDSSNTIRSLFKNKEQRNVFWNTVISRFRMVTRGLTIPALIIGRVFRPVAAIQAAVAIGAEIIPAPNNEAIPKQIFDEFNSFYNKITKFFLEEVFTEVKAEIEGSIKLFVEHMYQIKETEILFDQIKIHCEIMLEKMISKRVELNNVS